MTPENQAREMIRSAAVRKNGVVYVCWAHTYLELKRMNLDAPDDVLKHSEQGFVTSTGRFVDREEAALIARAAGQIKHKHGEDDGLYSEDLREQPTSSERCGECGHGEGVDAQGHCRHLYESATAGLSGTCLCKCVYPATGARLSAAAQTCLRYAEMIESQNDINPQVENWSDAHYGQVYAARQLAAMFSATGEGDGEQQELRRNPRVNALLVALRAIRDKSETLDAAKDVALSAIEVYIDPPAPVAEVRGMSDAEMDDINAGIREQFNKEVTTRDCMIASESVLAREWNTPKEDAAWKDLAVPVVEAPQSDYLPLHEHRWKCEGCGDQPSTVTTGEAANAAATEICDYCGIDTDGGEKVAAIISSHFPTGELPRLQVEANTWRGIAGELVAKEAEVAGEVERLRKYEREVSTLRVGYALEKGLARNFQKQIAQLRTELSTARTDTIREAVGEIWSLTGGGDVDIATGVLNQAPDGCWFTQSEITTALQSLLDKKEGEDGRT